MKKARTAFFNILLDGDIDALELSNQVRQAVSIAVIASSGAGKEEHFSEVFAETGAEAALAAGIFHRQEVPISAVKTHLPGKGMKRAKRRRTP